MTAQPGHRVIAGLIPSCATDGFSPPPLRVMAGLGPATHDLTLHPSSVMAGYDPSRVMAAFSPATDDLTPQPPHLPPGTQPHENAGQTDHRPFHPPRPSRSRTR
jgi:hypothetical protein